jgi:hypothetical protein
MAIPLSGTAAAGKAGHLFDIIRLAQSVLELLLRAGQPLRTLLLQPLITVALLLFLYAGWHVRDEGSVSAGLHVAFVDTRAYRTERARELEAFTIQADLRQSVQTDKLIDQLLTALLVRAPAAARVRLDVVHNGVTGVTGVALLRFDITNAVAGPGHSLGAMLENQPLSDWNEFLPTLLAGKCQMSMTGQEQNLAMRARLETLGAGAFMACPVIDIQGRMLGALFVTWDVRDNPPTGEALQSLMEYGKTIGLQIASALDLRGHAGPLIEGHP